MKVRTFELPKKCTYARLLHSFPLFVVSRETLIFGKANPRIQEKCVTIALNFTILTCLVPNTGTHLHTKHMTI